VLLRLTVVLVLAGLGLLWAGAARDSLGLIYLSILCTAIAGVGLIVYVKLNRRRLAHLATEGDPLAWRAREGGEEDAAVGFGTPESAAPAAAEAPREPEPVPRPGAGAVAGDHTPPDATTGSDRPPGNGARYEAGAGEAGEAGEVGAGEAGEVGADEGGADKAGAAEGGASEAGAAGRPARPAGPGPGEEAPPHQ
jgi:hypothetical protein